jgi:hypothetical protein
MDGRMEVFRSKIDEYEKELQSQVDDYERNLQLRIDELNEQNEMMKIREKNIRTLSSRTNYRVLSRVAMDLSSDANDNHIPLNTSVPIAILDC